MIAYFKTEPGAFYLEPIDSEQVNDYTYTVLVRTDEITVEVKRFDDRLFRGSVVEFGAWIKIQD